MLVFSLVAHEYAHGAVALREGDDTALRLGRLTLNPIPHLDPWMSVILPVLLWFGSHGQFTFGGAKPVPVDHRKLRRPRVSDLLVSVAGVATNVVLALLAALMFVALGLLGRAWPGGAGVLEAGQRMMTYGIFLNLLLAGFNLIPIPPLDGSHVVYHALPPRLAVPYMRLARFGVLPLMLIMFLAPNVFWTLLSPVRWGLSRILDLVHPYAVGVGWNIFQS